MDKVIFRIENELPFRMSKKRYNHSKMVADYAKRIALWTNNNPKKMYIAGLLHDVAKELSYDEILKLCDKTGKYIPSTARDNPHSLHGIAGACIAYEEYDIQDREILLAIAFHSGRVAMSDAEKILFISDCLSKQGEKGDWTIVFKQRDLDSAIVSICSVMSIYCLENNCSIDERTQDSFDYALSKFIENKQKDEKAIKEIRSKVDSIIDGSLDLYLSHYIKLKSIKNIRDIGGFITEDGKQIKKGKIFRSGALNNMSKQDADHLKQLGIDTIIDLRTENEINKNPDINIDGFKYINCPINAVEISKHQNRLEEYMNGSVSDEETAYYAAEYLRDIDMEQITKDIWREPDSLLQIKKVIEILLDENTKGVLFHCTSGKDRTGVVSVVIERALGLSRESLVLDYYASAIPYYCASENMSLILEEQGYSVDLSNKVRALLGIGPGMAETIITWWDSNNYEDVNGYYEKMLGLSTEHIINLRNKYLEK